MKSVSPVKASVVVAALLAAALFAGGAHSAQPAEAYTPSVGQEGKDVIWVPTPQALVERMLTVAKVTPGDFVVDLGSGDGRTVITAAKKFGARALGLEFNPDMVALSKRNAEKEGVADRAQFQRADIFATDFSSATVVTMYLLPSLNLKLRPTLLAMKPGTRIVSHAFTMDDWGPDQTENVEGRTAYLWIVPAKAEGSWHIDLAGANPSRYDVDLKQKYQVLEGQVRSAGNVLPIREGKVRGEEVTFTVGEGAGARTFTGRLNGDRMEGTSKASSETKFVGTRAK
ncbi:MAG TPA: class I SAM-dependent methyltransferase [Burkholderiales bacterium]|nr:class I SAM-dependent methyltransferase [Burkholderiales bacterium]